ncbi:MAG: calcium-translocating P-type ATPase, PMCA-type [Phascolarctobacterium sp.]
MLVKEAELMQKYGLSSQEVQESKGRYGRNILPTPPRQSFMSKLGDNLQDPMIKILLVALLINVAFIYSGHSDWLETAGIFFAIVLAVLVSTWSEYSNENAFQRLQAEASRTTCKVWRDGEPQSLPIEEIVVGDVVILEAGDKVPADGIVLAGKLEVDQAALNGESEPITKISREIGKEAKESGELMDDHSLFRGSVIVEGNGLLKVERIGVASLYGQLTQELREDDRESPLKLKLKHLATGISKLGYSGGVLIAVAVMLHKLVAAGGWAAYTSNWGLVLNDVLQAVILAIIIIVMAVPEGLPLMIAVVSSLNMRKMLENHVLVRKLVGIETAGSLNILFTDKTGTITKGQLEVLTLRTGYGKKYHAFAETPVAIQALFMEQVLLNTSATVGAEGLVGGNMTEKALEKFTAGAISTLSTEELPKRLALTPFNSSNKYSWAKVEHAGKVYYLIKGAPEKLLPHCKYYWSEEGLPLTMSEILRLQQSFWLQQQAEQAMRLLAICTYEGGELEEELPEKGLTLVGVVAIRDDVRPEAVQAIAQVQQAGVQVVMITGDRKETAMAIAREAGLLQGDSDLVWSSAELAQLSDDEVKRQLPRLRVVSRALPLDKLRLVRLAQEKNLVVGMTGDGVNDAPALKRADVGFAMGSGTEVAKEAGDIVILDDNFLSIKQAILYGRTIYKNICKFIVFQLTINFAAVATSFIAPFLGIDKPLTITQILWVNLVMDTLAALAFGGEPALASYMAEQPKRRSEPIVSRGMLEQIVFSGTVMTIIGLAFFESSWIDSLFRSSPEHIYTYTGFFCAFIMMAVANAFNVRTNELQVLKNLQQNPAFLRVMLLIVAVQIAMTYLGGSVLRTAPLLAQEWLVVAGCALLVLAAGRIFKLFKLNTVQD